MNKFIYVLIILVIQFSTNGGKKVSSGRGKTQTNVRPASNTANAAGVNRGNVGGTGTNLGSSNKNFGSSAGSFTSGRTGYKSLTSGQKAGIAGALGVAAGAYVGYKIGRATNSFHYGGHQYWYGNRYYHPTSSSKRKCIFEVDETTPNWSVKDEYDNSVVREIVFECFTYETCCGMSCCRQPTNTTTHTRNQWAWWQTLLVILVLGLLFAACAFFLIKQIKKRRQQEQTSFVATSTFDDSQKPFVPAGYSDANQTGYQPYPTAGPAPPYSGGYAPAPGYNYPPQPGYNYPPPNSMYPPPTYQPVRTY